MNTVSSLSNYYSFVLPRGLVDETGQVHREGRMRLATAGDELAARQHPQVHQHEEYLALVILSQVIAELGTLKQVSPQQLEGLFTQDLGYLKTFYNQLNQQGHAHLPTQCHACNHAFKIDLALVGEPSATP